MIIDRPVGTTWTIEGASEKLLMRSELPGARVFDLAADALRSARKRGVSREERLVLALPASWLVNSPANSRVLKRWALPPDSDTWLALLGEIETHGPSFDTQAPSLIAALGGEPCVVEAVSKIAALLEPDVVPLMPEPARQFVLGEDTNDGDAFVKMVNWFASTVEAHARDLARLAQAHEPVALSAAQVLDRLLWFDSEGHRHFVATAK